VAVSRGASVPLALAIGSLALATAAGCTTAVAPAAPPPKAGAAQRVPARTSVNVLLAPTKGHRVRGSVRFLEQGRDMLVMVDLHGLEPGSRHGMHLHEKGDCSGADGMAAGGHFNPGNDPHGPQGGRHHAGDLPMIVADANGVSQETFVVRGLTLSEGAHSIVGKALIVHADADDYTTQPTGNSGARIACGVVK
jgi:Cu-Zn family superoxide dismutase